MISPKSWQVNSRNSSGSNEFHLMRADRGIKMVDNYLEKPNSPIIVFPTVGTGGVSIITRSQEHQSKLSYYEHGEYQGLKNFNDTVAWGDKTEKIFEKLRNNGERFGELFMNNRVASVNPFGINTNWSTDKNNQHFRAIRYKETGNDVRVWGRGANKKYQWMFIDRNYPFLKTANIDYWKVLFPLSGVYRAWRSTRIVKPGEVCTATFIHVPFNSEEECKNFVTFFQTSFYRFLLSERGTTFAGGRTWHSHIPDLAVTVNPRTHLKGWESDWNDEDLQEVFAGVLLDSDWKYIKKKAVENDPTGERLRLE